MEEPRPWPALPKLDGVFERLGFRHTSLDINGRDGAVVVDLSRMKPTARPLNVSLLGHCDVVTNFGTTEHVGVGPLVSATGHQLDYLESTDDWLNESEYINAPADFELLELWSSQYEAPARAFRNIHQLVRPDGLIINMVPAAGCWAKHGAVDYEPRFFGALAGAAGYEVMNLSLHRPAYQWSLDEDAYTLVLLSNEVPIMPHLDKGEQANVLSVFRRHKNDFMEKDIFRKLPGIHRKSAELQGSCLKSSKLWVEKQCEEEMAETDSCSML
eukprot:Skav211036  [mRNA]  locus=scaffold1434:73496:78361:+ [translate_table: standard]